MFTCLSVCLFVCTFVPRQSRLSIRVERVLQKLPFTLSLIYNHLLHIPNLTQYLCTKSDQLEPPGFCLHTLKENQDSSLTARILLFCTTLDPIHRLVLIPTPSSIQLSASFYRQHRSRCLNSQQKPQRFARVKFASIPNS